MRRSQFYVCIGVLALILIGGSATVSNADSLNFTFWDTADNPLTFVLDTTVLDSYPDNLTGYFVGAISGFEYGGLIPTGDLNTLADGNNNSVWAIGFSNNSGGGDLNLTFLNYDQVDLVNTLSSYPNDYTSNYYWGDIWIGSSEELYEFYRVDVIPVPEPSLLTLLSIGAVGLWGYGWGIGRSKRVQRNG